MKKFIIVIIGIMIAFWAIGHLPTDPVKELEEKLMEAEGKLKIDTIQRDLISKQYQEALGIKTKITTTVATLKNEATEL